MYTSKWQLLVGVGGWPFLFWAKDAESPSWSSVSSGGRRLRSQHNTALCCKPWYVTLAWRSLRASRQGDARHSHRTDRPRWKSEGSILRLVSKGQRRNFGSLHQCGPRLCLLSDARYRLVQWRRSQYAHLQRVKPAEKMNRTPNKELFKILNKPAMRTHLIWIRAARCLKRKIMKRWKGCGRWALSHLTNKNHMAVTFLYAGRAFACCYPLTRRLCF